MNQEVVFVLILGIVCVLAIAMQIISIIYTPRPNRRNGLVKLVRDKESTLFANLTACEILNGVSLTQKGIIIKEIRYDRDEEVLWVTKSFYIENKDMLLKAGFKKVVRTKINGPRGGDEDDTADT